MRNSDSDSRLTNDVVVWLLRFRHDVVKQVLQAKDLAPNASRKTVKDVAQDALASVLASGDEKDLLASHFIRDALKAMNWKNVESDLRSMLHV